MHLVDASPISLVGGVPQSSRPIFGFEREHTSQGWRGEAQKIQSENSKFWQRLIWARSLAHQYFPFHYRIIYLVNGEIGDRQGVKN